MQGEAERKMEPEGTGDLAAASGTLVPGSAEGSECPVLASSVQ